MEVGETLGLCGVGIKSGVNECTDKAGEPLTLNRVINTEDNVFGVSL